MLVKSRAATTNYNNNNKKKVKVQVHKQETVTPRGGESERKK